MHMGLQQFHYPVSHTESYFPKLNWSVEFPGKYFDMEKFDMETFFFYEALHGKPWHSMNITITLRGILGQISNINLDSVDEKCPHDFFSRCFKPFNYWLKY